MVSLTNPLLADPSRTGMIRKQFCQSMTKVFRELSREISDYLVSPEQVLNSFCPTGKGGGVDPTCSPKKGIVDYSHTLYRHTNNPSKETPQVRARLRDLHDELSGEPTFSGTVYRAIVVSDKSKYQGRLEENGTLAATRPLSSSKSKEAAMEFGSSAASKSDTVILFKLKTNSGVDISKHVPEEYSDQKEVLLKPGGYYVLGKPERAYTGDHGGKVIEVSGREVRFDKFIEGNYLDSLKEPTVNAAKVPEISQAKIDNFEQWIISRMTEVFDAKGKKWGKDTDWWAEYIEWSFRQGAARTFDEVRKKHSAKNQRKPDWYNGTRDQFLSSAFNSPVTKERLKVLVGRTYKDIKGLTTHAAQILTQTLTDGMIQGRSIKSLAADLQKKLDISKGRAFTIARTEVIRAHAEGQLSALEAMGIEDVSVNVEWQTAGDKRVCPKCRSLGNKVFKVKDAHGIIPVHPNCRCAFIPAFTKPDMTAAKARTRIASVLTASKKKSS